MEHAISSTFPRFHQDFEWNLQTNQQHVKLKIPVFPCFSNHFCSTNPEKVSLERESCSILQQRGTWQVCPGRTVAQSFMSTLQVSLGWHQRWGKRWEFVNLIWFFWCQTLSNSAYVDDICLGVMTSIEIHIEVLKHSIAPHGVMKCTASGDVGAEHAEGFPQPASSPADGWQSGPCLHSTSHQNREKQLQKPEFSGIQGWFDRFFFLSSKEFLQMFRVRIHFWRPLTSTQPAASSNRWNSLPVCAVRLDLQPHSILFLSSLGRSEESRIYKSSRKMAEITMKSPKLSGFQWFSPPPQPANQPTSRTSALPAKPAAQVHWPFSCA